MIDLTIKELVAANRNYNKNRLLGFHIKPSVLKKSGGMHCQYSYPKMDNCCAIGCVLSETERKDLIDNSENSDNVSMLICNGYIELYGSALQQEQANAALKGIQEAHDAFLAIRNNLYKIDYDHFTLLHTIPGTIDVLKSLEAIKTPNLEDLSQKWDEMLDCFEKHAKEASYWD